MSEPPSPLRPIPWYVWLLWIVATPILVWTFGFNFKRLWLPGCDVQCHEECREFLE